jgi:hypothetical protein
MSSGSAPYIPPPPTAETAEERTKKLEKAHAYKARILQQANGLDNAYYRAQTGPKY